MGKSVGRGMSGNLFETSNHDGEVYFNTTNESGERLKEYKAKASTQNKAVLECLVGHKRPMAASQVHESMATGAPLTSIRRALNTLENDGLIMKTGDKVKSPYGRNENLYSVREWVRAGK